MEPIDTDPKSAPRLDLTPPLKPVNPEIVTLEECKQHLGKFNLSDERILEIRNNMVGIVDQILAAYINNYR